MHYRVLYLSYLLKPKWCQALVLPLFFPKKQVLVFTKGSGCSSLNLDLFSKNITYTRLCNCGTIEDTQHFFNCGFFQLQRTLLLNKIRLHGTPTIDILLYEPVHEIFNNVVCATSKGSDQPAHTRSLIRAFASRLSIL